MQLVIHMLVIIEAMKAKVPGIQFTQRKWLSIDFLTGTGAKIMSKIGKVLSEECLAYHERNNIQRRENL